MALTLFFQNGTDVNFQECHKVKTNHYISFSILSFCLSVNIVLIFEVIFHCLSEVFETHFIQIIDCLSNLKLPQVFEKHCPKYESTDELLSNCKKDKVSADLISILFGPCHGFPHVTLCLC